MNLRTWRRLFVVGFVVMIVQVGVLDAISVGGAHPDGFLLFAIAAGLIAGAQHGAVIAFVTGLVADLFVPTPFGLSALCYVIVAFGVGLAAALPGGRGPRLYHMTVTFVASVGATLLFAALLALLGQPHLPRNELLDVVLVVSVANAVLAVPAVAAMHWAFGGAGQSSRDLLTTTGIAVR